MMQSYESNPCGIWNRPCLVGEHLESVKAGNWCGILCAKPFQSIAALALTLFKIGDSWVLAAFEYICAVLYAMPAYAAILAVGKWA